MSLIKDGEIAENVWRFVEDGEALGGGDNLVVTLDRWCEPDNDLAGFNNRLGVRLKSDQGPDLIADDLDRFDLIELDFPTLPDGRAFSYARLLRERYGYKGEIRAVGDIIKDQLFFMQRCGINSFDIPDQRNAEDALNALGGFSAVYQPAADDLPPGYRQRSKSDR